MMSSAVQDGVGKRRNCSRNGRRTQADTSEQRQRRTNMNAHYVARGITSAKPVGDRGRPLGDRDDSPHATNTSPPPFRKPPKRDRRGLRETSPLSQLK
ncbi:hypothetical protein EYF80_002719 [Liparis tanakae]|uniref:Uncharacterized protein n=1 Tax=Liparis tanakae TaxID=230148 RepID=A0A4Z2JAV7_9TELE|nr:hypothetical protein EYF80_002719 [Liparis tanakae]